MEFYLIIAGFAGFGFVIGRFLYFPIALTAFISLGILHLDYYFNEIDDNMFEFIGVFVVAVITIPMGVGLLLKFFARRRAAHLSIS